MAIASTGKGRARRTPVRTETVTKADLGYLNLPTIFIALLAALAMVPSVWANPALRWSVLGAAGVLFVADGVLYASARSRRRVLELEFIARRPHYLQAVLQSIIYAYWGYHFRLVYDQVPLIAAQLAFAYAVDMLLAWSHRDRYTLGFGQFPIIFSINLFIWFKPEWYYLQFALVALGFAAKEFIRWQKDGQSAHIFNPSSFPLALFSLVLIVTGSTSMTYGVEIATTQFNPPHIYLLLFLIGLPGQFFFGVTPMTATAVITTYLFGLAYYATTGTYFFVDSYIPISVFLGMHLLFTDPSTAPRTELGRIGYGVLYAFGNIVLYEVLGWYGIPSFYDKLLPVPLMNLSVRAIDRMAQAPVLQWINPENIGRALAPRRRYLAYMTVWAIVFAGMSSVQAVGDEHPGHRVPFWVNACQQDLRNGCSVLESITARYCNEGSGWACNELGVFREQKKIQGIEKADANFERACALGFSPGCENRALADRSQAKRAPATVRDYPIVLKTGKGEALDGTQLELFTRACDAGFMEGCGDLGGLYITGQGTPRDPARAAMLFEKSCRAGFPGGCSNLGLMYFRGDGVTQDKPKGLSFLKQACDQGSARACEWYAEQTK